MKNADLFLFSSPLPSLFSVEGFGYHRSRAMSTKLIRFDDGTRKRTLLTFTYTQEEEKKNMSSDNGLAGEDNRAKEQEDEAKRKQPKSRDTVRVERRGRVVCGDDQQRKRRSLVLSLAVDELCKNKQLFLDPYWPQFRTRWTTKYVRGKGRGVAGKEQDRNRLNSLVSKVNKN